MIVGGWLPVLLMLTASPVGAVGGAAMSSHASHAAVFEGTEAAFKPIEDY